MPPLRLHQRWPQHGHHRAGRRQQPGHRRNSRHPRPGPLHAGRERSQGLHHRRSAHAHRPGVQRLPQNPGGTPTARHLHPLYHRSAQHPAHHHLPLPALRLPTPARSNDLRPAGSHHRPGSRRHPARRAPSGGAQRRRLSAGRRKHPGTAGSILRWRNQPSGRGTAAGPGPQRRLPYPGPGVNVRRYAPGVGRHQRSRLGGRRPPPDAAPDPRSAAVGAANRMER